MGSLRPSRTALNTKSPLKFITPVRAVFAASAPPGPFHRDRFRGRSPADARRREESALEARSKNSGRVFSRNAVPSPARWRCRPGTCQVSPFLSRAATVFAAPRRERKARRWVLFSCETFRSTGRSPRRLPSRRSRLRSGNPLHLLRGAETIRVGAAPSALLAGGYRWPGDRARPRPRRNRPLSRLLRGRASRCSFLLRLFALFFPGISRWSSRFAVRGVSPALRMDYIILFISADDLLHQVVPHHVLLSEVHYTDPVDFSANFQRLN